MADPKDARSPAPPSSGASALTYRAAGVDIDAGNEAVRRIRRLVASTRRPEQLDDIGGFAGMIGLPTGFARPTLVSCADGVGTKLLVAIAMDKHDTIGIDAVAMNVNDLLCTGGQPLFVLDYVACGQLDPAVIEQIVGGVVEGCRASGAALLGGETAELPGLYAAGHYDVAAFAVGVVDRDAVWGPARVQPGDVVLGLLASGLHSNGYSLARKALLDPAHRGWSLDMPLPGEPGVTVGEALLRPTRIYARAFDAVRDLPGAPVHAAAHITGGGLLENPPRVLPPGTAMELDLRQVPIPAILQAIADAGVPRLELRRTFNCGVGMLLVVDPEAIDTVYAALERAGEAVLRLGQVLADGDPAVRFVD
jgi:phosphoribosylformylglycinamidine cyclo-ligase